MEKTRKIFTFWTILVSLILAAGCTHIAPEESAKDLAPIRTIGVLPAQIDSRLASEDKNIVELETGAATMDGLLAVYFQSQPDVSLVSQMEIEGLSFAETSQPFHLAREAGEKLHYDAILVPSITRYQERDGSEFAVTSPASVAFSLRLLDVKNGMVVWSGDFDQEQQPLLENILPTTRSTGAGFRWLTAAELISAGLNKKLDNCPYLHKD